MQTYPLKVVTIISPLPFAAPVLAIILFGDSHSADNKQSNPHMVSPIKSEGLDPKNSPLIVNFVPGAPSKKY